MRPLDPPVSRTEGRRRTFPCLPAMRAMTTTIRRGCGSFVGRELGLFLFHASQAGAWSVGVVSVQRWYGANASPYVVPCTSALGRVALGVGEVRPAIAVSQESRDHHRRRCGPTLGDGQAGVTNHRTAPSAPACGCSHALVEHPGGLWVRCTPEIRRACRRSCHRTRGRIHRPTSRSPSLPSPCWLLCSWPIPAPAWLRL